MGVAAAVGLTLAAGIWKAKTEYDANKAAARQAEANATIADLNADKEQSRAYEIAKENNFNEEVRRRQAAARDAADVNSVGGSGLSLSGSNALVAADNHYNRMLDIGIESYNQGKNVDNAFESSTNFVNQRDQYKNQADQYKKAARNSLIKNAIETGASIGMMYVGGAGSAAGKATKTTGALRTKAQGSLGNLAKRSGGSFTPKVL